MFREGERSAIDLSFRKVNEMKGIADKCVQQCGCNPDDAGPWKAHWDHQALACVAAPFIPGLGRLGFVNSDVLAST